MIPQRLAHVLIVHVDEDLSLATVGVLCCEIYDLVRREPATRHLVIDAAAMSDLDDFGLVVRARSCATWLRTALPWRWRAPRMACRATSSCRSRCSTSVSTSPSPPGEVVRDLAPTGVARHGTRGVWGHSVSRRRQVASRVDASTAGEKRKPWA